MKWNDIKNHLKHPTASPVPASIPPAPVTPVVSMATPPDVDHLRKWAPAVVIFLVIIAAALIIYLMFIRKHEMTPLSEQDTASVQTFFESNPPAQLAPADLKAIDNFFNPEPVAAPAKPQVP